MLTERRIDHGACLTVVLIDTNNDGWLPHTDPPNP
jgi:hypothetical protein